MTGLVWVSAKVDDCEDNGEEKKLLEKLRRYALTKGLILTFHILNLTFNI